MIVVQSSPSQSSPKHHCVQYLYNTFTEHAGGLCRMCLLLHMYFYVRICVSVCDTYCITYYIQYRMDLNFRGTKLLRIENFRIFIFADARPTIC